MVMTLIASVAKRATPPADLVFLDQKNMSRDISESRTYWSLSTPVRKKSSYESFNSISAHAPESNPSYESFNSISAQVPESSHRGAMTPT